MPGPYAQVFEAIVAPLEAHVPHIKPTPSLDVGAFDEVISVDVISDRPRDTPSRGRRLCFGSKFDLPLASAIIVNMNLLGSARLHALDERELAFRVGSPFRAARSGEEIAALNIGWLLPQYCVGLGAAATVFRILLLLFLFFFLLFGWFVGFVLLLCPGEGTGYAYCRTDEKRNQRYCADVFPLDQHTFSLLTIVQPAHYKHLTSARKARLALIVVRSFVENGRAGGGRVNVRRRVDYLRRALVAFRVAQLERSTIS